MQEAEVSASHHLGITPSTRRTWATGSPRHSLVSRQRFLTEPQAQVCELGFKPFVLVYLTQLSA